jgi:hypothetical protein
VSRAHVAWDPPLLGRQSRWRRARGGTAPRCANPNAVWAPCRPPAGAMAPCSQPMRRRHRHGPIIARTDALRSYRVATRPSTAKPVPLQCSSGIDRSAPVRRTSGNSDGLPSGNSDGLRNSSTLPRRLHDIRKDAAYADCLSPTDYARSQALAATLLAAGSAGLVYPSVGRSRGTCIVCFRQALVTNVRRGRRVAITV